MKRYLVYALAASSGAVYVSADKPLVALIAEPSRELYEEKHVYSLPEGAKLLALSSDGCVFDSQGQRFVGQVRSLAKVEGCTIFGCTDYAPMRIDQSTSNIGFVGLDKGPYSRGKVPLSKDLKIRRFYLYDYSEHFREYDVYKRGVGYWRAISDRMAG